MEPGTKVGLRLVCLGLGVVLFGFHNANDFVCKQHDLIPNNLSVRVGLGLVQLGSMKEWHPCLRDAIQHLSLIHI